MFIILEGNGTLRVAGEMLPRSASTRTQASSWRKAASTRPPRST
jgi:hypothetical protein